MTNDELAAKIDEKFAGIDQKFAGIDQKFDRIDDHFARVDRSLAAIDQRFDGVDKRFDALEKKVDDGFQASKLRDEGIRDLAKVGLEAHEILREEMHRRFDESDRKNDEQITLLKDAVRHLSSHR